MRAFEILIETIVGRAPKGETTLRFSHSMPKARQQTMQEIYASTLVFESSANQLLVPKSLWYLRSPLHDPESHAFNLRKCQQLFEQLDEQSRIDLVVTNQLRKHFERRISEFGQDNPPPSLQDLCALFHTTERTLIRKLKELNTSYKQLLMQERCHYAELLLKDARYTIFQVAEILGYRESANFCRAFKRWCGLSPSEYRRAPQGKE